jgi:hypothetical protein
MRTAHSRLNSWNTSSGSFQKAENRPLTAQKVVEHRQESYRNARLRRVKSAVGSQRTLNPNVERLLKSSKQKIKRAKPTRHFKAWNDRETAPPQKERKYRRDDLKSRLPTRGNGAKKVVEKFASSLRGGSITNKKQRYRRPKSGDRNTNRKTDTRERSKNYAKAQEALVARKRMKRAKAAALKAKQMERQMQHVRRIKRLDTTIRPVLGNRTNTMPLPLSKQVDKLHNDTYGYSNQDDNINESDREDHFIFNSSEDHSNSEKDEASDNSFIPNFNSSNVAGANEPKYDGDFNRWNPMFGNILSPLQETNEEESQSLNAALSPEARHILNSAREKRMQTKLRQVRTSADSDLYDVSGKSKEEVDQIRHDIYGAVSPEHGILSKCEDLEHEVENDNKKPALKLNTDTNSSPHKLSESLDCDLSADEHSSSSSEEDDEDEENGVEALARNFYSGMKNIGNDKNDPTLEIGANEEAAADDKKHVLEKDDTSATNTLGGDDEEDKYDESFIVEEQENSKTEYVTSATNHLDHANDDDETPIWNTPRTCHYSNVHEKTNNVHDNINMKITKQDEDMQSPRTFVSNHMTFLRAKAFQTWNNPSISVDESVDKYSDDEFEELDEHNGAHFNSVKEEEEGNSNSESANNDDSDYSDEEFENEVDPRKALRESVNKKFAKTLETQLKKELSHTDLFNSNDIRSNDANSDSDNLDTDGRPNRRGGIAFVC